MSLFLSVLLHKIKASHGVWSNDHEFSILRLRCKDTISFLNVLLFEPNIFHILFLSKAIKSLVQMHKMYCCLQASPVWKILPVCCCCYPLKGVCGYYRLLSFKYDFLDKIVLAHDLDLDLVLRFKGYWKLQATNICRYGRRYFISSARLFIFFLFCRRTVNSNRPILECSNDQNCKIDKHTRKRCQFCRFEVCIILLTDWLKFLQSGLVVSRRCN